MNPSTKITKVKLHVPIASHSRNHAMALVNVLYLHVVARYALYSFLPPSIVFSLFVCFSLGVKLLLCHNHIIACTFDICK